MELQNEKLSSQTANNRLQNARNESVAHANDDYPGLPDVQTLQKLLIEVFGC